MTRYGMLIDTTTCVGCYECENACAIKWGNPTSDVPKLSASRNTAVATVNDVNVPHLCMHCADPTCASVCPVGAFSKTPEGPVVYNADKCIGCRYCMQACPFDIPKYEWSSTNPKVAKCNLCSERITRGQKPACVEVCPAEARIFGTIDDLILLAQKKIQDNPVQYINHIYGVKEAGGTSVLFLSGRSFEEIGLKAGLPDHPLPTLTWQVLSHIPNYVFWGSTMLAGIWWITNRRKEVAAYERALRKLDRRSPNNGSQHSN
ncbi:MAG: 4Fe-4S dicluster domain-containing protein [Ignavibacteriales bacterium]|nr:4Fe-4S dicluster domain-containing protein [Ignavibacteriales bacterium]